MHVEELFIGYFPDGTRAGEFPSELEALRFLYAQALARLRELELEIGEILALLAKSAGI